MWKSNFVLSIDNLVSLESWDILQFIFIRFNFIKEKLSWFSFNWILGCSQVKKSSWNQFQETVKLFFEYWLNYATFIKCLECENYPKVFCLVFLHAKPGIFSLCRSVTKILQKVSPCSIQQECLVWILNKHGMGN